MKYIPYVLFISVFSLDYLSAELGVLPRAVTWIPELLSGFVLLLFIFHISTKRSLRLHPKYVVLFFMFCLIVLLGIILNSVNSGTVFTGLRYYFKYIPFFLLPVIYEYTNEEIQKQLRFLLFLGFVQTPLVIFQKFVQNSHPDLVTGTLEISSVLSFYLVSALSILFAFYLKKKIDFGHFLLIALLLFIPTTLNETKGTIFLLLVSFAVIMTIAKTWRENRKELIIACSVVLLLLGSFAVIYNANFRGEDEGGLVSFFTEPEKGILRYLYTGAGDEINPRALLNRKERVLGEKAAIRPNTYKGRSSLMRIDTLILPFQVLSTEPTKLVLGLGMGNVSDSFFGGLSGAYTDIAAMNHTETAMAILIWELGLAGFCAFLLFFYFIYKDSKALSKKNIPVAPFAIGWCGIVAMFVLSLPYKNFLIFNVLGCLIMYFSGYIAASCWAHQYSKRSSVRNASFSESGITEKIDLRLPTLLSRS